MKWSFITTCFNNAAHLPYCLKSLLSQTIQDWECIIVDDQSTDNSLQIAKDFSTKDPRFRIIQHSRNAGYGAALHTGFKHASGKLCGVVDADDGLVPHAAESMTVHYDKNPDIGFIWSRYIIIDHRDHVLSANREVYGPCPNIYDAWGIPYSHWRTFRTTLRDKIRIVDPSICAAVDKDMGFRLEEIAKGLFIPEWLYIYRTHPNNLSHRHRYDQAFYHGIAMERARIRRKLNPSTIGRGKLKL